MAEFEDDHILTEDERKFLDSFSCLPKGVETLRQWALTFYSRYYGVTAVRALTSKNSAMSYMLVTSVERETNRDSGEITFSDEEKEVLHRIGRWDMENLTSTKYLIDAAHFGNGTSHNVIKRLVELLVQADRREKNNEALELFKSRVRDKAKEVAREMDWCLEGTNRVLRSLGIDEWDTLENMVEIPVRIEAKQYINTTLIVREGTTTLHTDVEQYLRDATISYDDFEWSYDT